MNQTAYFLFAPTVDPDEQVLNDEQLAGLVEDTGLDAASLRNSLTGNGIGCLRRSTEREPVEQLAQGLAVHKIPFLYVRTEELDQTPVHVVQRVLFRERGLELETPVGTFGLGYDTPMVVAGSGRWDGNSMKRNLLKTDWFVVATGEQAFLFRPDAVKVEGVPDASQYSNTHRCIRLLEELFRRASRIETDSSYESLKAVLGTDARRYGALLSLILSADILGKGLPGRFVSPSMKSEVELTANYDRYTGFNLWRYQWRRHGGRTGVIDGKLIIGVFVVLLIGAFETGSEWLLTAAFTILCLGSTYRFFKLLHLKRLISDTPTSKLRSVSAGFVEVTGRIHGDRLFVSPISGARCVCFRYEKQRRIKTQDGYKWRTVEIGEAFPQTCFLDDETGVISMNLRNARLMLTTKYRADHTYAAMMAGIPLMGDSDTRYIEEYLQDGQTIYAMGTATPVNPIILFGQYVATMKRNEEVVRRFDLNGDGRLDEMEWERAIPKLRQEFMAHMQRKGQSFGLMIDFHRDTPVFIVSNEREGSILGSLAWRVPAYLGMGLISFITTTIMLFKVIGR